MMCYIILDTLCQRLMHQRAIRRVYHFYFLLFHTLLYHFILSKVLLNFKGGLSFPLGLHCFFHDYTPAVFSKMFCNS